MPDEIWKAISELKDYVARVERDLGTRVTRIEERMGPVRIIVFGMVGLILTTVLVALIGPHLK